jgi:hypothetical protein
MGIGLAVERYEKFKRKDVRIGTFKDVTARDDRQKTNKDRQRQTRQTRKSDMSDIRQTDLHA